MFVVLLLVQMIYVCVSIPVTLNPSLADNYLDQYGYYTNLEPRVQSLVMFEGKSNQEQIISDRSDTERQLAIKKLQNFFDLPQTGQLDERTIRLMKSPRCGVSDVQNGLERIAPGDGGGSRHKRYAFKRLKDGSPLRWNFTELTWSITSPSKQFPVSEQREVIIEALNIWRKVVPINFREEINSGVEPDINIKFGSRSHGPANDPIFDGSPKDIPSALAHAWGPHRDAKGFPGDVHFDEEDKWNRTNFLSVAVHELGHTMGLLHSKNPSAIMFPEYRESAELSADDITGIHVLYDTDRQPMTAPPTGTRQPSWNTTPSTKENITCTHVDVEAIFLDPTESSDQYIVISGQQVYNLSSNGQLLSFEPLNTVFPDAPMNTDVAFSYKAHVYFIKDYNIWVYYKNQILSGYPRALDRRSLPETPRFALLFTYIDRASIPLLFGNSLYWVFNEFGRPTDSYNISDFVHQFPKDVVFATQWIDQYVYAVSRDSYVKIDRLHRQIISKEPVPGMPDWMNELCFRGKRNRRPSLNKTPSTQVDEEAIFLSE